MKLLYIVVIEIRDYHGHTQEWGVYATSTEDAVKQAQDYGRVLSCRRLDAVIGE